MKIFNVNNQLHIEADADGPDPLLRLVDRTEAAGGDPLWVIIYPRQVKALVAALISAAVWVTIKWIRQNET